MKFQTQSSVTPHYYKGVPAITGNKSADQFPFVLQDFADMCMEAVYVLENVLYDTKLRQGK